MKDHRGKNTKTTNNEEAVPTKTSARAALKAIELLWEFKHSLQAENISRDDATTYLSNLGERTGGYVGRTISSAFAALYTALTHFKQCDYSEGMYTDIVSRISEDLAAAEKSKPKRGRKSKVDYPENIQDPEALRGKLEKMEHDLKILSKEIEENGGRIKELTDEAGDEEEPPNPKKDRKLSLVPPKDTVQ